MILFYSYGDFTTQSSGTAEGLWYGNGTLQDSKVKLLSRTYAQVIDFSVESELLHVFLIACFLNNSSVKYNNAFMQTS